MISACNVDEDDLSGIAGRLSGLACFDNRSLNIFTLDYNSQMGLARSLGLDERTVQALIVNPARETYYSMKEEFSLENLANFIEMFHRKPESLGEAKLSEGHLSSKNNGVASSDRLNQIVRENCSISIIDEMNRDAFLNSDRTKPLLLLYVAPSCGFCTAATRAFHAVRRYFSLGKNSDPIINFSTINTSNNDLPWSFTAFSTPSVIYVPAGSDSTQTFHSDSRVFPSSKPLNVTNLLSFVVANLPENLRLIFSTSLSQFLESGSNPSPLESHRPPEVELNRDPNRILSSRENFQSYHEEL